MTRRLPAQLNHFGQRATVKPESPLRIEVQVACRDITDDGNASLT